MRDGSLLMPSSKRQRLLADRAAAVKHSATTGHGLSTHEKLETIGP